MPRLGLRCRRERIIFNGLDEIAIGAEALVTSGLEARANDVAQDGNGTTAALSMAIAPDMIHAEGATIGIATVGAFAAKAGYDERAKALAVALVPIRG